MKLVTWNINGIRASTSNFKKLLESTGADVICLQETKITKDQLESDIALIEGYNSYFSFSQVRSGYSGVATFCKDSVTPIKAQAGLTSAFKKEAGDNSVGSYGNISDLFDEERLRDLDNEGRAIITVHDLHNANTYDMQKLAIINVYCPRADPDKEQRKFFKLDFYKILEERAKSLMKDGNYVLIVGDINTSHKPIDHCDPQDPVLFYDSLSRTWLDAFVYNNGEYSKPIEKEHLTKKFIQENGVFVDSFRFFYPKKSDMFTCWCTSNRARETNYGTRLDYIFSDVLLSKQLVSCEILYDVLGSDHCPVEAVFDLQVLSSSTCPLLCTNFLPTFGGKQQKLLTYFQKFADVNSTTNKRTLPQCQVNTSEINPKKKKTVSQMKLTAFVSSKAASLEKNKSAAASSSKQIKTLVSAIDPHKPNTDPNKAASEFWKKTLKGPTPAPLCAGHNEPCVLRIVKKNGPNLGRQFYCCGRPEGHRSNPEARCQFFQWHK